MNRPAERQGIANSQAAVTVAADRVRASEAGIVNAAACVGSIQGQVEALERQDSADREARSVELAGSLASGAPMPAGAQAETATRLAAAREQLSDYRGALGILQRDHERLEQNLRAAEGALQRAIEEAEFQEAQAALRDAGAAVADLTKARRRLYGVNGLAVRWRHHRMPHETLAFLGTIPPLETLPFQLRPIETEWAAFREALAHDPDAKAPNGDQPPPLPVAPPGRAEEAA